MTRDVAASTSFTNRTAACKLYWESSGQKGSDEVRGRYNATQLPTLVSLPSPPKPQKRLLRTWLDGEMCKSQDYQRACSAPKLASASSRDATDINPAGGGGHGRTGRRRSSAGAGPTPMTRSGGDVCSTTSSGVSPSRKGTGMAREAADDRL